jgi:hypothetical protein
MAQGLVGGHTQDPGVSPREGADALPVEMGPGQGFDGRILGRRPVTGDPPATATARGRSRRKKSS